MVEKKRKQETQVVDTSMLQSNSQVTKNKDLKSVVKSGGVEKRKKPLYERFLSMFISEDAGDVKSYLISDILIPALKDTIVDMVCGGIEVLFHGNEKPRHVQRSSSGIPKVSYQKYYEDPKTKRRFSEREERIGTYNHQNDLDFKDIKFHDKRDAIAVLNGLVELTLQYEVATVMDLKQLAGLRSEFTDNDFGWENLTGARVVSVRGGYVLDLPIPIPID